MAFCSNCGNPLTGKEKFCAQCGADVSLKAAATPAPAPAPSAPSIPVQPMAAAPTPYTAAPPMPVAVPVPTGAQPAQKKGMMGTVIAIVIVAGLGYYYYTKTHPPTPADNPPASQPSSPSTPPSSGSGSGGGGSAALVNLQNFNAHWQDENGMLVLTTASWANNSNVTITSASLQCRQFNAAGTDLSEYRWTLNGPTNAGATSTYSNISLGATATGMTKVDCEIIHVKPAS